MEEQGETRKTYSRRTLAPREGPISQARDGSDGFVGRDTQRIMTTRTTARTFAQPVAPTHISRALSTEKQLGEEEAEESTLLLRAAPISRQSRALAPASHLSRALAPVQAVASDSDRLSG